MKSSSRVFNALDSKHKFDNKSTLNSSTNKPHDLTKPTSYEVQGMQKDSQNHHTQVNAQILKTDLTHFQPSICPIECEL